MLEAGQAVVCRPQTFTNGVTSMKGTVIWIHPKRRFARVMFELHGKFETSKLVESFSLIEMGG